ncbi:MAG: hypothetical protein IM574_01090 [Cytophagales bacterium]|jgi:hypothetical protein|nr:hypothetical protein [Cytophagales bacterium]MCA6437086.1 hypothetical protein [Bacteroidota bacterium]MCA6445512.1 hypothetical protein [Bacteroidota bacterium]MCA6492904.1 hypothetical protein [Chitinophagaceae bacterium]
MNTYADKKDKNKSQSVANTVAQKQSNSESTFKFVDNRPEAIAQRKLQEMANNNPRVMQLRTIQKMANGNTLNERSISTLSQNSIQLMHQGDYSGFGSDGRTNSPSLADRSSEKITQAAVKLAEYIQSHPSSLVSTAAEMVTGTVDVLAIQTALKEIISAGREVPGDIGHGNYLGLLEDFIRVNVGLLRAGASVAPIAHAVHIPLAGDIIWYGSKEIEKRLLKKLQPMIFKTVAYKQKIGKMD